MVFQFVSCFGLPQKARGSAVSAIALAFAVSWPAMASGQTPPQSPSPATQAPADEATQVEDIIVTGTREANATISGLRVEPLRLPQNVRVIDDELIQNLGATRIADIFTLSGISPVNTNGGTQNNFSIRGFTGDAGSSDILVNRFNASRGFEAPRDVATIARFEVLKGPAAALSGAGEPGGTINIVTLVPRDDRHAAFELGAGSFSQYRGVADVGGPISESADVRLIVVGEDNGSFRDFVSNDRLIVAPSVSVEPTERLRLLYQYEYGAYDAIFDRGVVIVDGYPFALPRERFLGEPNDGPVEQRSHQHQGSLFYDLTRGLTIEGGVQYREGTSEGFFSESRFANAVLPPNAAGRRILARDYVRRDDQFDDLSGRLELAARATVLGLDHQLRVGVEAYAFETLRLTGRNSGLNYGIDLFDPVYGQPKPATLATTTFDEAIDGRAVYVQDLIQVGDFSLLLGLRYDQVKQDIVSTAPNGTITTTGQEPSATSPRIALTYAPFEQFAIYASYGRSFRINQGASLGGVGNPLPLGTPFEPQRGRTYEVGVKFALLDRRLSGTVSAYDIVKSNLLVNGIVFPGNTTFGEYQSRGIEADVNYRLDDRLTATAYYGYIDAEATEDRNPLLVGRPLNNVPRHSGALFVRWASAGDEAGSVTVAGGVTYVGDRAASLASVSNLASPFGPGTLPAYTTVQANLGYRFTDTLSAQLDLTNIFDEYYLESSNNDTRVLPGEPRAVRLTLRKEF